MTGKHWSDDELIARLYGIEPSGTHLEECAECAGRWQQLVAARERVIAEPAVSEERMTALRRATLERIEQPARPAWRPGFAPVLASLALLLLALVLTLPAPGPQPTMAVSSGPSESELFAEIYTTVETTEPAAVAPIRSLFEEEQ